MDRTESKKPHEWAGYYLGIVFGTLFRNTVELVLITGCILFWSDKSVPGLLLVIALSLITITFRQKDGL